MSENPVDYGAVLSPHGRLSTRDRDRDRDSSVNSFRASIGIVSLSVTPPKTARAPCSISSSLVQASPTPKQKQTVQHRMPEMPGDPLLNRVQFHYPMKPRGQPCTKALLAVRRPTASGGEEQQLDGVEASVVAVQREMVGMLTRHLPEISEGPAFSKMLPSESSMAVKGPLLDDRITPQTLHALLNKGRTIASKIVAQDKSKRRHVEEEKPVSSHVVDSLRTQVDRLEPPYVDHMLQAKAYKKTQNGDGTLQREVLPITASGAGPKHEPWQAEQVYHSHLIAPPPSRLSVSRSPVQHAEEQLQRHLSVLSSSTASSMGDEATSLKFMLTRSTSVGDDAAIIDQVVAYAASRRRPEIGDGERDAKTDNSSGIPSFHPSYNPVFSVLDAVLSVSKEFEKVQQTWPGSGAAQISASRHAIIDRLVSLGSSRIPRDLWVTIHSPTFPGSRQHHQQEELAGRIPAKTSLLFPAVKATGRAQVYLLADTLDRMLQEIPDALAVLADKEIAQRLLPKAPEKNTSSYMSNADVERLIDPLAMKSSDNAHLQYVETAKQVMEIVDAGLVEIVRQVSGLCAERGALLDALRLVVGDVLSSSLWLVGYCKDQARHEAETRRDLIAASRRDVEEAIMLREELRKGRQEVAALQQANGELEGKASKYDTLMERLQLKDKNFSKHPPDQHLRLLMELEESYTQLTTKGLEELYECGNLESKGDEKVFDAPTTHMNNLKQEEQQVSKDELYVESYRLLNSLTDALRAVDGACQPLYERLALPNPFSTSQVASSKWTEIAHAVGSFEVEKKHRRQVFEVFARWNNMLNNPTPAPLAAPSGAGDDTGESEYRLSSKARPEAHDSSAPSTKDKDTNDSIRKKRAKFITRSDLTAMGVKDCTPDEINALYAYGFDMAAYLRPEWTPPGEYEMSLKVIRDMVHDVTESLRHITLRMEALSNSSLLKEATKPPPKAPARPDDPCEICGRRDNVAMEKKNKGEIMQRVANEIQRRYEEIMMKCQRAEADREAYRKDLQRFQMREKKQMQEWVQREDELKRANAALAEDNRQMAQNLYMVTHAPSPPRGGSPHSHSPKTASVNTNETSDDDDDDEYDSGE
ncbi:hypothetical protein DQ04_00891040 [Trypanosoma grayi]|uniref:hypothetical protein n=1 Tax=Trypanosoma grayi TaxID=71804 RepID=UPI0004F48928|nr:hypothetical protein DQ04_00891040 [Trypanosoma grayi]KEG13621.1 hypothetical protein DQ04_00891040 [Trypanosoma grayi]